MKNLLPYHWDRRPQFPDPPLWLAVLISLLVIASLTAMIWLVGFIVRWLSP